MGQCFGFTQGSATDAAYGRSRFRIYIAKSAVSNRASGDLGASPLEDSSPAVDDKAFKQWAKARGPSDLDPRLLATYEEVWAVRHQLGKLRNKKLGIRVAKRVHGDVKIQSETLNKPEAQDRLSRLQQRLDAVDSLRSDGRFKGDDGSFAPQGQAVLSSIVEECYAIVSELLEDQVQK
jgi:hypothetical protein